MSDRKLKNALVIGGTGIIGKPTVMQLIKNNEYNVYSIALEKTDFSSNVKQHIADRTIGEYKNLIQKLNSEVGLWDVVVDVVAFDAESAEITHSLFKNCSEHIITLSTTLVYDRTTESTDPISENTPLAPEGHFGGYVDGKVKLEKFWQSTTDVNWTLIRPYHILGAESLLGCIPEHNRDPKLIEKIKNGEILRLCNGGSIFLNCIHPKDIAGAIYKIIGNPNTFKQAYNLVNPKPVLAKDYYAEIAKQVGGISNIEAVSMDQIWQEKKGWEMTTLPHVYSMQKMEKDVGFVPNIKLEEGICDAIENPPKVTSAVDIPVHQRMNKLPSPKRPNWLK
ncbi:MAG: NAD-dependent epimerase/dehydratase family protein [Patescibacteria group bacterium]